MVSPTNEEEVRLVISHWLFQQAALPRTVVLNLVLPLLLFAPSHVSHAVILSQQIELLLHESSEGRELLLAPMGLYPPIGLYGILLTRSALKA